MKTRRVVYDEANHMYKVVWFGSIGKEITDQYKDNKVDPSDLKNMKSRFVEGGDYLDVNVGDMESIRKYKEQEVVISLSTLRGELKHSPGFGFRGLLSKYPKELLDIEVMDVLRNQVGLLVSYFNSVKRDRSYDVSFKASTSSGIYIDMTYSYSYEG